MTRRRPEQRRGIPLISGIIEQVKQLTRYTDAELDAAVLSAFLRYSLRKQRLNIMENGQPQRSQSLIMK